MRRNRITTLERNEQGQMAFLFLFTFLIAAMFFAIAFDAGLWLFDHRTAQNQAEAAALAAVQQLPSNDTTAAAAAADEWLVKNGSGPEDRSCLEFSDVNGDGDFETVRVCVRRASPGLFASLSGISFAYVSASATAMIGPAGGSAVMPWAVLPPDPDCDPDGNGCDLTNSSCPDGASFDECPWGLNPDQLLGFKSGGGGNTGIIDSCGQGAVNYNDCITGDSDAEFFEEGSTIVVGLQGGNLGTNTDKALTERQEYYGETNFIDCDLLDIPPDPLTGVVPGGALTAKGHFVDECAFRLVLIPILYSLPSEGGGSISLTVLGVATFGIASWNRENTKDAWGTSDVPKDCAPQQGGSGPDNEFSCGMIWGFLVRDVIPPDYLLEQINLDSKNPFAPLLIALID